MRSSRLQRKAGYWLRNGQDPARTPVWHWELGWVLLHHDGTMTITESGATDG